jgi:RimJ/RimL family protein N-acetyltransferase
MAYWVAKGYLHQGIGESIARTIESMALNHRPYQYVYINHDSNNRASGAIPQRLGYQLLDTFNTEVSAKLESGFWFSWIKESSRYADCENERLRDLRYAILWCQMIKEMHPDIYMNEYAENHSLALKEYGIEQERVRTNNQNDVE